MHPEAYEFGAMIRSVTALGSMRSHGFRRKTGTSALCSTEADVFFVYLFRKMLSRGAGSV